MEAWKLRDPIPALARQLREVGLLDEAGYAAMEAAAEAEVADAVAYADSAGVEPVARLLDDLTTPLEPAATSDVDGGGAR